MPVDIDPEKDEASATRRLRKSGNSTVVSLPPELLRKAGFEEGDEIEVAAGFDGGEIELRKSDDDADEPTPN